MGPFLWFVTRFNDNIPPLLMTLIFFFTKKPLNKQKSSIFKTTSMKSKGFASSLQSDEYLDELDFGDENQNVQTGFVIGHKSAKL